MDIREKLEQISRLFCIKGTFIGYQTIQVGNVNQTYEVRFLLPTGKKKSYLLQNVNTYAFRRPVQLMENIDQVTEHIRRKKPGQIALHFHHTADRKIYVADGDNFWRMTNFIPSVTYSSVIDQRVVRNAGRAFGEFQMQLSDFDISKLHETIPGFHDTRLRYKQLMDAVKADPVGRLNEVHGDVEYLMRVKEEACRLTDLQKAGLLPLRVTHNDTKINNVLFNPDDQSALVVIDLDTVMPGLVGHDFGDAIRFAANTEPEDSLNYRDASLDLDVFSAFTDGFLEMTATTLTTTEIETLALSCFSLTVELATRFLTDYLLDDPYFKTSYPEHNLVRARCQIALSQDMHHQRDRMMEIIHDSITKWNPPACPPPHHL